MSPCAASPGGSGPDGTLPRKAPDLRRRSGSRERRGPRRTARPPEPVTELGSGARVLPPAIWCPSRVSRPDARGAPDDPVHRERRTASGDSRDRGMRTSGTGHRPPLSGPEQPAAPNPGAWAYPPGRCRGSPSVRGPPRGRLLRQRRTVRVLPLGETSCVSGVSSGPAPLPSVETGGRVLPAAFPPRLLLLPPLAGGNGGWHQYTSQGRLLKDLRGTSV